MLLSTRTRFRSREQVGWVMNDGLVTFERVRDWEALSCQRHICKIQGYEPPARSKVPLEPLLTPLPAEQLGASRETFSALGAIALRDARCGAPCEPVLKQVDRYHVSRAAYPHHLGCPGVLSLREVSLDTRTVHCLGHRLHGHREGCMFHGVGSLILWVISDED